MDAFIENEDIKKERNTSPCPNSPPRCSSGGKQLDITQEAERLIKAGHCLDVMEKELDMMVKREGEISTSSEDHQLWDRLKDKVAELDAANQARRDQNEAPLENMEAVKAPLPTHPAPPSYHFCDECIYKTKKGEALDQLVAILRRQHK